ncbi:MAG: hypothetical protein DRI24_19815 [Deltaproteobacteria bacterium]|nr:MAG: hypothetical protein DRI24_19815 [Deltaproteobacteria bacterium]
MTKIEDYRNGGEGFIKWVEDNVWLSVFPEGSDIPQWMPFSEFPPKIREMWKRQQEHLIIPGLEMNDGEFKYRLLIAMWPRGEGKSVEAILIQLWRFFCFPKMTIILGANSSGQVRFHHFEEMVRVISNSPKLITKLGKQNLQQRQIQMKDSKGNITSFIRPVSSFTGIYSGCTGYTFNEFHQAKNFKFFTEIDSSMRGVKNGLGVIDTTVAPKSHILYKLYQTWKDGKDPYLFYSYRQTKGTAKEFWNPGITQEYLNSQKERLPFGEFERFYINSWSAGAERVFTDEMIEATNFLGIDNQLNVHPALIEILTAKNNLIEQEQKIITPTGDDELDAAKTVTPLLFEQHKDRFEEWDSRLWPVDDVCSMVDAFGNPAMVTIDDLQRIGDMYDTDWAILAGMDRADPMKTRTAARTIVTAVAKGLTGSRSNPYPADDADAPRYLYFLLQLKDVEDHSIEVIKDVLISIRDTYDGIDAFGSERWGAVDMEKWCQDNTILPVIYYPTYGRQRTMFTELYLAYKSGRFKTPIVHVRGQKQDDILKEEASVFDHNPDATKGKFGSPEKYEKYGIQDDCMFSVGSAVYAGINLGVDSFRERKGVQSFGMFFKQGGLLGRW